jgi:hypothetical protein
MKTLIFFLFFASFYFQSIYADAKTVRVIDDSGSVSVMYTDFDLETAWKSHPLYGHFYVDMDDSELPKKDEYRNFWKLYKGKIIIDQAKKDKFLSEKSEKVLKKESVLSKLKITNEELDTIIK